MAKYVRVGAGQYRLVGADGKPTGPIINSATNPGAKSSPSKPSTKTRTPRQSTPPTTSPNAVNIPSTKGLPPNIKELIPVGQWFGEIFTRNVNPRTIDTAGIDASVADAQQMFNQAGQTDPFTSQALEAIKATYDNAGAQMGQEDALLNYITQGALQGFSPEQMQVARESARAEIDRSLQGLLRGAMGQGANLGVFGSDVLASAYPGMRLGMDAMANLERDLFLSNIQRQDRLADRGIELGNEIRKRRFGEILDGSGNFFSSAFSNQEANRNDRLNRFENLANMRNAQATYQGMNNDSLNAFELAKVGALTGGLGFADSVKTNNRVLDMNKQALNLGRNRQTVSSPALATSSRVWNQPATATNNSSMAGSSFS